MMWFFGCSRVRTPRAAHRFAQFDLDYPVDPRNGSIVGAGTQGAKNKAEKVVRASWG
jgi:hypothetical protein